MAKAPAAAGGGGGAVRVSEVDSDRLWRDRVHQELHLQRQWVEEYGFMVSDEVRERLRGEGAALASPSSAGGISPNSTLKSSKSSCVIEPTPNVGVMTSTMNATYQVRPSPELKNDSSPHRRKKHPP